jgi:UDP-N-acetylmuramyl pentapeptide phosphotransferase/UDP-N-acetylglucosamine-1-phosphate transferase
MIYLFFIIVLFAAEIIYFKIADRYNIIDKPNHRSSHSEITIRGGGIIFPLAILLWFVFSGFQYPLFILGLLLISAISFADDLKDLSKRLRLITHLTAIICVFFQLNLFSANLMLPAAFILIIGVINAYNFMDGINGITGIYSLVTLATLLWINIYHVNFVDSGIIISAILGAIVFNFFNSRKKAVCFAGDVGSISMAYIICFLLMKLIMVSGNIAYVLLLSVYGIDTVYTIIFRVLKGENIFLAHRLHLYQLLVNERHYQHVVVALIYGIVQLIVNIVLINMNGWNSYQVIAVFISSLLIAYMILRSKISPHQIYKPRSL